MIVNIRPADGGGYPVLFARLFMYDQLFGDSGEFLVQVRLVRINRDDLGEETEHPVIEFEWKDLSVTAFDPVEPFAFALSNVPFPDVGTYEFQLWAAEVDEPLASERIEARE